ncbi:MAG: hypothetical protein IT529_14360 [Burkholderiales bacterium]|nr:hypothetical protein [Burkholderiales bacterium]
MPKLLAWIVALAAFVLAAAAGIVAYQGWRLQAPPSISTPFHAVLLVNGQAFFGRLNNLDSEYLVLHDVHYIQSRTNPETKQVANVLVKRGQEWHAPDRMIVNRRHVILLEPVTEGSQVAKLIAEQATKK